VRVAAVAVLALVGSCAAPPAADPLPLELGRRLQNADPAHPAFEQILTERQDLFEAILQIDQLVYPDLDVPTARRTYESLCRETDRDLKNGIPEIDQAASAFLKTLDRRQFVYDLVPPRKPGQSDSGVVSHALLRRTGSCGSFSLLCMAYLQARGLEASLVCVPEHCFLAFRKGDGLGKIECTDFEMPIRPLSADPEPSRSREGSGHCGRPLDASQALWHYYVDRLWSWVPWRSTDPFALLAIARGRSVLGSSCLSIDAQETARRSSSAR
jgi:hypothetical protein